MQQISIFEVMEHQLIPYDCGDLVRVTVPKLNNNAEDHYYLSNFANKRGCVQKIVKQPKLQYHVDFDGKEAIVYHSELKYW